MDPYQWSNSGEKIPGRNLQETMVAKHLVHLAICQPRGSGVGPSRYSSTLDCHAVEDDWMFINGDVSFFRVSLQDSFLQIYFC